MDDNSWHKSTFAYEAVRQSTDPSNWDNPTKSPRHPPRRSSWLDWLKTDSWTPEWLALAVSVASLICIVVMLRLYDGTPLASWSHIISLNTALSTLGTIMKGFMLCAVGSSLGQLKWLWYAKRKRNLYDFQIFDQASRGPWGSFRLLFQINLLSLGTIAALVTLLSLASDSFIQQSVSYPPWESAQANTIATVPMAQSYMDVDHDRVDGSGGFSATLPDTMMAAIYDGILATNLSETASVLRPNCPSGNCTFPAYVSLGMCSRCANVTSKLNFTNFGNGADWSLPNGLGLGTSFRQSGVRVPLNMTSSFGKDPINFNSLPLSSDELNAYVSNATISNTSVIMSEGVDPDTFTTAYECTLFLCVRSYVSSTRLHVFSENVTGTFDRPVWDSSEFNNLTVPNPWLVDDGVARRFDLPEDALPGIDLQNRTFSLGIAAQFALQRAFGSFNGEVDAVYQAMADSTSDIAQMFYQHTMEHNGVSKVFDNIAAALTNAIRKNAKSAVTGTVFSTEAHIVVQWWWLSLPVVMVLLAIIVLGATIVQTHRHGVPNWRSSELAIMAYGVRARTGLRLADYDLGDKAISNLEAQAKTTNVELQRLQTDRVTFCLNET